MKLPGPITAVVAACLAGLLPACFGPVLLGDRQFGFRDSADFYYPLYLRVQQEWDAGRLPLWSAEENAGMPLLGNPTAAVLYPGKIIYGLMPYAWGARVYVVAHILLAFAAIWWLLRSWGISATGSALGGLSYAFGAPVLTQYCNVIFLVGAAWLPLGFLAADRWLRLKRRSALAWLALVLAMETLGGDPQVAYVTVVCASGYAVGLAGAFGRPGGPRLWPRWLAGLGMAYVGLLVLTWWSTRTHFVRSSRAWSPPIQSLVAAAWIVAAVVIVTRWWLGRDRSGLIPGLSGLGGACVLALALTGAQLVPVVEFIGQSPRAAEAEGMHDIYPLSLHPFQAVEGLWPRAFGTTERANHSWLGALPPTHDFEIWFPSLYLGGLTVALAISAAGFRDGPPWRTWLTAVVALGLLASLGLFGSPLFWARCVPSWAAVLGPHEFPEAESIRNDGYLRDGDGGFFWFVATVLPIFRSFRFPAKFLIFACLGISGLAGLGWDRLVEGRGRRVAALASGLLSLSLLVLVGVQLGRSSVAKALASLSEHAMSYLGPLDVAGALADLRGALVHGSIAFGLTLVLAAVAPRRPRLAGVLALAFLATDLAVANAPLVVTVPQSTFESTPRVLALIEKAERENPSMGPFRVFRMPPWVPMAWNIRGSPSRAEEVVRWERDTLRPKYGLPFGVQYTMNVGTAELFDYTLFFADRSVKLDAVTAREVGQEPGRDVIYYPRRGFDLWNTRYFILPARIAWNSPRRGFSAFLPRTERIDPDTARFEGPGGEERRRHWLFDDDVQILRNEAAFPRAWIVHKARILAPIRGLRLADRVKVMNEILFQDDDLWRNPDRPVHDPHKLAWVETDRPKDLSSFLPRSDPDPSETVTVHYDGPRRVELIAALRSPGLVILSDVFYPGWHLTIDGRPAEPLRVNRVMRGAAVDAGTHRLVYHYDPLSLRVGIGFTLAGLVALASLSLWATRQPSPLGR